MQFAAKSIVLIQMNVHKRLCEALKALNHQSYGHNYMPLEGSWNIHVGSWEITIER